MDASFIVVSRMDYEGFGFYACTYGEDFIVCFPS